MKNKEYYEGYINACRDIIAFISHEEQLKDYGKIVTEDIVDYINKRFLDGIEEFYYHTFIYSQFKNNEEEK